MVRLHVIDALMDSEILSMLPATIDDMVDKSVRILAGRPRSTSWRTQIRYRVMRLQRDGRVCVGGMRVRSQVWCLASGGTPPPSS